MGYHCISQGYEMHCITCMNYIFHVVYFLFSMLDTLCGKRCMHVWSSDCIKIGKVATNVKSSFLPLKNLIIIIIALSRQSRVVETSSTLTSTLKNSSQAKTAKPTFIDC